MTPSVRVVVASLLFPLLAGADADGSHSQAVYGGALAGPGSFPQMAAIVSLYRATPQAPWEESADCGGTLVAPDLVITAAHCVEFGMSDLERYAVRFGATNAEVGGLTIPVRRVEIHPRYVGSDDTDVPDEEFVAGVVDVALLFLESPAPIPPAPLATGCVDEQYVRAGTAATLYGYGFYDRAETLDDSQLRTTTLEILEPDCANSPACRHSEELIAGSSVAGACAGDSGGPLLVDTPYGVHLVGVVSRAALLPSEARERAVTCDIPVVYSRVAAFQEWIEQVSGRRFDAPECPASSAGGCATARPPTARHLAGGVLLIVMCGLVMLRLRRST